MRRDIALPFFLAVCVAVRGATADGLDPVGAAALFQEGREAAKKGDYARACSKLTDSYRLDPAAGTLLNLADCEEHLGKLASAWQHFQKAFEVLPPSDARAPIAKKKAAKLEPRLPRLAIALEAGAPPETQVTRGGVLLGEGSLDSALPVNPGTYVVVVTAKDRQERRFEVTVMEGESARLAVAVGPPEVKGPPRPLPLSPPPPEPWPSPVRTAGLVVGGVGVAGIGVALATGFVLMQDRQVVADHCPEKLCDPMGSRAVLAGQALLAPNGAAWIAGGVLVAASAVLLMVGRGQSKPAASVAINVWAGGAAAVVEGRF